MENKYDIFISYSRKNLEQVKKFKEEIEISTNARCWMDLEGIESGTPKFTKAIIHAINACPIFLFMLSEESQKSENAIKELDFAYKKYREEGKKVVIVYIVKCKMTDEFSFDYSKADTIDLLDASQYDKLIRDIIKWIKDSNGDIIHKEKKLVSRMIERDGRWGYADLNWNITIHPTWKKVTRFKERLAAVEDFDGKWGFINMNGDVVIPLTWEYAESFNCGLSRVHNIKGEWGVINKNGEFVLPLSWKYVGSFHNGLARIQDFNGMWGFVDKNGDQIVPCVWNDVSGYSNGLSCVINSEGRYGFIDKKGEIVVPCTWEAACSFSDSGLARVKNDKGEWGYLDITGSLVIPCKWRSADDFHGDFANVTSLSNESFVIDRKGNIIKEIDTRFMSTGHLLFQMAKKYHKP